MNKKNKDMNCIKRLPRSAGEYRADTEYLPQDRVSCDGSIFVSLRRQSGSRPSVTVNGDGTIILSYPANETGAARTATLVLRGSGDTGILARCPATQAVKTA